MPRHAIIWLAMALAAAGIGGCNGVADGPGASGGTSPPAIGGSDPLSGRDGSQATPDASQRVVRDAPPSIPDGQPGPRDADAGIPGVDASYPPSRTWTADNVPTQATLRAIWGSGPSSIFAVGDKGTVIHFDGNSWSLQSTPTQETLLSVWGSAPSDVWACGYRGLLLHYDGNTWTKMPEAPKLHASGEFVSRCSLWGRSHNEVYLYAIERGDPRGTTDYRILRFDGQAWSGSYAAPSTWLAAIHGTRSHLFAIGASGVHHDGQAWATVKLPRVARASHQMFGVWGVPKTAEAIAVGVLWSMVGNEGASAILHFDGTGWKDMAAPQLLDVVLIGACGRALDDAYAVGGPGTYEPTSRTQGNILHYDGQQWQEVHTANRGVYSCWVSGSETIAVGRDGLVLRGTP